MRYGILIESPEGAPQVVLFTSRAAAEAWRDTAEGLGVTTQGMLNVVSRVEAILNVTTR